jgi:DNA-binding CsgD family transcriptional regulator
MAKQSSGVCADEIASPGTRCDDGALQFAAPRLDVAPSADVPPLSLVRREPAAVVLDATLKLRGFTPSARDAFGFDDDDIGAAFARLELPVADPLLDGDLRACLVDALPIERDIETEDGCWYRRSAHYCIGAGVVVAYADITERKLAALSIEKLTARERAVIEQVIAGQPNKVIAFNLAISRRTVEYHRQRAMTKLEVGTLAALIRLCVLAGLRSVLLSVGT